MKKVVVIVGPTTSGKTSLSIELAERFDFEIINGDSVQVYKELTIGSAKITPNEMNGIKHHLLDFRSINEKYTVFDFQTDAREILDSNNTKLMVGGTGLYIKAALYNYEFDKKTNNETEVYDVMSTEELYNKLLKLDPSITIDMFNRRRVLRALMLAENGNLRSNKISKDMLLYDALVIYLDLNKEELSKRLVARLEKQLSSGFIEEVKSLREGNIFVNAIGYKEIYDYLDGKMTLDETKERIIISSRQLAKKQKTFFKNQMNPHFVDALDPNLVEVTSKMINDFLEDK